MVVLFRFPPPLGELGFNESVATPLSTWRCRMGSLGETRAVRRQFWLLIRAGLERRKAARAVGLCGWTGKAWFRQAGGVIPACVPAPLSARFLSEEERIEIFGGL